MPWLAKFAAAGIAVAFLLLLLAFLAIRYDLTHHTDRGGRRMKITDQAAWDEWVANNTDPYGSGVVRFAQRWGDLMDAKMADGAELEDIADATSHEADTEGITGFMYGCAVQMLAGCWEHGERLRRWHNLDTQIGNEGERANESGGVLNPAILNLGGS